MTYKFIKIQLNFYKSFIFSIILFLTCRLILYIIERYDTTKISPLVIEMNKNMFIDYKFIKENIFRQTKNVIFVRKNIFFDKFISMVKVGEALFTIREKFINYLNTLINEKFSEEEKRDYNEAIARVKQMNVEGMITYISMFILPNRKNFDLYIKNQISNDLLNKITTEQYEKVKRYLDCMADIVSDK